MVNATRDARLICKFHIYIYIYIYFIIMLIVELLMREVLRENDADVSYRIRNTRSVKEKSRRHAYK